MTDQSNILKEKRKSKRREQALGLALLSPYAVIFVLFSLIPVLLGVVFSFLKYNPYQPEATQFIGLDNFLRLFDPSFQVSAQFWGSFRTMFLFALVMVPTMLLIPLVLAYFVNLEPPGYKLFRAILYLPSVVSVSIMGIIFSNIFAGHESGLVNALFHTNIKWLSGLPFEGDFARWFVMFLATIWWQTGTNFVILSGALRDIPKPLYEACEMDGGGRLRSIITVTLPGIRPSLSLCLFTTLIGFLGLYGQPVVLNDMTNASVMVSPMMWIQRYLSNIDYAKQTGYICACALMFGLVVAVFSLLQQYATGDRRRKTAHRQAGEAFVKNRALALTLRSSEKGGKET